MKVFSKWETGNCERKKSGREGRCVRKDRRRTWKCRESEEQGEGRKRGKMNSEGENMEMKVMRDIRK